MAAPVAGGAEAWLRCEGAPRDLGLDQGLAMGEGVDAELVRILRRRVLDHSVLDLGRDVERHFPHLAERAAGLARGAGVKREALWVALARALREPELLFQPVLALGATPSPGAPAILAGRFDLSADRCSVPVLRRSEPHGGFVSLELTLPWLVSSLGGVNAEGLAVLLAPAGHALLPGREPGADSDSAAPGLLLVQQCLERFDRVETAADWCATRPAAGALTVLLADARGGLAAVELDDRQRRRVVPDARGLLWAGGSPAPASAATTADALARDPSPLPALLGERPAPDSLAHRIHLWLSPATRELAVLRDHEGLAPVRGPERYGLDAAA